MLHTVEWFPFVPGSWAQFFEWATPFMIASLAFATVAGVLRYREWADYRTELAEYKQAVAAAAAADSKVLDRRSSRVRDVEAATAAIEIVHVVPHLIVAPVGEQHAPDESVLPTESGPVGGVASGLASNGHTRYWAQMPSGWAGPFRVSRARAQRDLDAHRLAVRS